MSKKIIKYFSLSLIVVFIINYSGYVYATTVGKTNENEAQIYIIREKKLGGSMVRWFLMESGTPIGVLYSGSCLLYRTDPGVKHFSYEMVKHETSTTEIIIGSILFLLLYWPISILFYKMDDHERPLATIEVQAKKKYYYIAKVKFNGIILEQTTEENVMEIIREYKEL